MAGAAACEACEGATVEITTLVPDVLTTTLVPVVVAEAAEEAIEEATELALAALKELCMVKLQRVKTSRTSLSFTLSSSSVLL